MDIPAESLDQFKCSKCEYYLRRAPVHLQPDGLALCAACFKPSYNATRDKYYEAAARLLRFPCRNTDLGCKETVPFLEEGTVLAEHEEVCPYRQYVCPLLGSSRCVWLGTRNEIAEHCSTAHSELVLENPTTLIHDITVSSQKTFLLTAFNALFLLYVKVCTTSAHIYHSIRYLGTTADVSQFKYILQIKRQDEKLEKIGSVASQGCLAIQEPTSLALGTNSLLSVLGGGDGITFTVTLQRTDRDSFEKCAECYKEVTILRYHTEDGWYCEDCILKKKTCENNDCNYQDYPIKCYKHKIFFCAQSTKCIICGRNLNSGSPAHYTLAHKNITHRAGYSWQPHIKEMFPPWCLLSSEFGTALCMYTQKNSRFKLYIYFPLPAEQLRQICCEVKVKNPSSGNIDTYTPDLECETIYLYDWKIDIDSKPFHGWRNRLNIIVNFYKKT